MPRALQSKSSGVMLRAASAFPVAVLFVALACGDGIGPDSYPGPGAEVALTRATTVGKAYYPIGNWPLGGQGQPISGVACIITTQPPAAHVHAHVSLYVDGEQIALPPGIGVINPVISNAYVNFDATKCFYELHTHDATGVVHVHPNAGQLRTLTLGQLFDLWGQALSRENVGGFRGKVTVFLNQVPFEGDIRSIPLDANTLVSLQVGLPLVAPPKFIIPANP